ncbi:MAG: ACP S-malonyltransferase, partial [Alphaproteobacteria bacterium]
MNNCFLFPGQGSQSIGMGLELYNTFSEAKEVFQEVDESLSRTLSKLIFHGEIDELTQTQNAQPAIMALSLAATRVIEKQSGKKLYELGNTCAGHSLGEYSAYAAAGSFTLADTALLLNVRGSEMAAAAASSQGSMIAILGADLNVVDHAISKASEYGLCCIANDNSADQVVLSGSLPAINYIEENYKELGIKRAIKLNVSGAFHSEMMSSAQDKMKHALESVTITMPRIALISNTDVDVKRDVESIKASLVEQIVKPVRWRETMMKISEGNTTKVVEIGVGKVLGGIAKKMLNGVEIYG